MLMRERRKGRSESRAEITGAGFHLHVCLPMPTLLLRVCNFVIPPLQVHRRVECHLGELVGNSLRIVFIVDSDLIIDIMIASQEL